MYPKGDLDLDVHIDGRDALQVKFRAHGNDLDPWQPLRIEQPNKDFQTKVSVDISIDSAGKSPHELAANAKGNIYLTAIDGKLRSSLIDLLLVDVVGWTLHRTTGQKYLDVDCGLADYSIDQGIISTTALFLEGKNIAITGTGTIDLGQEQIDFAILPQKKSRFIGKADPVTIKGPLNDPTVAALPWKSAAKTYGGYVFAPQFFIPLRLTEGLFGKMKKEQKSPCQEYKEAHDMSGTGEKSQ
ncbi:MAG: AsmA-like C-terminal region-containing protein [Desulfobacterales bacterium]